MFPTVKSRRPKAFPYAPVRQVLRSDGGDDERYPHKTRQIRAPGSSHPRTVSVGRKPETKPGPPKKRILQRFGRPHPFQPIPSPRRRFPAGWIPTRPFHTQCGIKIPLIPPQRQRKSVPSRRRSDGKPPRRLVRFLWFAAKIRQSRYPLHRLKPEKRFCIQRGPPSKSGKAAESALFPKNESQRLS